MSEEKILPRFVDFKTKDGLTLPGLLYEPKKKTRSVVIFLHGNGSSSVFYKKEKSDGSASVFAQNGIALFRFNNRGAHIIKKLTVKRGRREERKRFGMAYEKIKECIEDIDGAIAFLKKQGYDTFYLAGSSTGANKICVYNFYKPKNEIKKYVLLCGGDDTGIYYQELGKKKFWALLAKAKQKIKKGKGGDIITELLPNQIFSYMGFYDIANPDGDYNVFPFYEALGNVKLSKKPLFRYFKSITKPSLVVYGDKDEYSWPKDVKKAVELLRSYRPELDYKIVKGANHGFDGHQRELDAVVAEWLSIC